MKETGPAKMCIRARSRARGNGDPSLVTLPSSIQTAGVRNGDGEPSSAVFGAIGGRLRALHGARPTMTVGRSGEDRADLVDTLYAENGDPTIPGEVFDRLRWGGLFVYASKKRRQANGVLKQYGANEGFLVERGLGSVRVKREGIPIPFLTRNHHYVVARKVRLVEPGRDTSRFTFDVQLARRPNLSDDYVVMKRVPTHESVVRRLVDRYPQTDVRVLMRRAAKLVDRVFPVFLTRETGFLEILNRKLPDEYKRRIPKVLAVRRDGDRLVRKVYLNWMRPIARPMSQLEFARQGADLLRVLHDTVGVIHLDLRLDNYVISEHGVGFVDFGSAVRVGEGIDRSPMLQSLFDEMMSTSQIQKMLGKMAKNGRVTSKVFTDAHGKIDRAADLFYLTLQMTKPHANPDFKGLIEYDKDSDEAVRLAKLARRVLRPTDPGNPPFRTAAQLLDGIEHIEALIRATAEDEMGIDQEVMGSPLLAHRASTPLEG